MTKPSLNKTLSLYSTLGLSYEKFNITDKTQMKRGGYYRGRYPGTLPFSWSHCFNGLYHSSSSSPEAGIHPAPVFLFNYFNQSHISFTSVGWQSTVFHLIEYVSNYCNSFEDRIPEDLIFSGLIAFRSIHLLTHWGPVTHMCINKLTIIGTDNVMGILGTNLSEIVI